MSIPERHSRLFRMDDTGRSERFSYHVLITVMLASAPLEALAGGDVALMNGFWAGLPIAASFTLMRRPALFVASLVLGLAACGLQIGELTSIGAYLGAAAFAFTTIVLLQRVFGQAIVTSGTISAALCVYLLVGVTFTMVYRGILLGGADDGVRSFVSGSGEPVEPHEMGYFSFVTLTTVGFGDITPRSQFARSLVVVEALLGQLYLVAVVAQLVGRIASAPKPAT